MWFEKDGNFIIFRTEHMDIRELLNLSQTGVSNRSIKKIQPQFSLFKSVFIYEQSSNSSLGKLSFFPRSQSFFEGFECNLSKTLFKNIPFHFTCKTIDSSGLFLARIKGFVTGQRFHSLLYNNSFTKLPHWWKYFSIEILNYFGTETLR